MQSLSASHGNVASKWGQGQNRDRHPYSYVSRSRVRYLYSPFVALVTDR